MSTKFGQFMVAAIAGCTAWTSVWPYEVIKNLAQAETKGVGNTNLQRFKYVYRTYGMAGFYRGVLPGL